MEASIFVDFGYNWCFLHSFFIYTQNYVKNSFKKLTLVWCILRYSLVCLLLDFIYKKHALNKFLVTETTTWNGKGLVLIADEIVNISVNGYANSYYSIKIFFLSWHLGRSSNVVKSI